MTAPCSPDSTSAAAPTFLARSARPGTGSAKSDDDALAAVRTILADVRTRGDQAVRELTLEFDGCDVADPRVPAGELAAALEAVPPELRTALGVAADRIRAYHSLQADAPSPRSIATACRSARSRCRSPAPGSTCPAGAPRTRRRC